MSEEDTGLEEDLGTLEERRRVFLALKEWAHSHPDPDTTLFVTAVDMRLTLEELVEHIEDETAVGVAILDVLVLEARSIQKVSQAKIVKLLGRQFPLAHFREVAEE